MADSSSPTELQQNNSDDALELNKDLERMIEDTENMSVQLTWMAYDMVALRTNPELVASMKTLEEAYYRCRVVVSGETRDQRPEATSDKCPESAVTTLTPMQCHHLFSVHKHFE
ncbi:LOW QUALITY PROTEIN: synaptonemal complex central element protein 3 [Scomber japonicus]|uniref:LOW QUALITY PROTEIN: synaptonemal complex central element protein 3 n=1 Tax=Scomber japonicus TaxID=13676 RepID=UPI00230638F3|nr:LOW QUALITY PROTEIN: synaptonemal complex central element protein 3 [Scomber japonicus]